MRIVPTALELAGHARDAASWRMMHDFATDTFPRAGAAFADMHVALTQAVARDDAAFAARAQQIDALAREGRYPSGPCVPAVSHAFAAFERGDFTATSPHWNESPKTLNASAAATPSSIWCGSP